MISGAVFAVVAAVFWLLVPSQVDTMETTAINAQTFPRIAIGGLFLFSAALFLQGLITAPKKEVVVNREALHSAAFRKEMRSIFYALILIAYTVLLTFLGFLIATVLLVIAILLFYGARKWYYFAVPLVMVAVVYFVFASLLHVSLPKLF